VTAARSPTALAVALAAFLLYHATLLPGVDLGDSGSFQTMVGSPYITPRDAYPLYFAIGAVMLNLTGAEPAHALNLTSAIEAAVACGLFVIVAAALTESIAAAAAGALLFAVSYTFWSQSVTAEVYALHTALVLGTVLLLFRWERQPTIGRLAAFFAVYALAFGNHLSMILLMPALVVFLFLTAPGGWRSLVAPRVVALAVGIACLGATQYLWNLRTLWFRPDPPTGIWDALNTFWFDVTKSDWRESMVMQVPPSMRTDHVAMYWFDLQQQFGLTGILLRAWRGLSRDQAAAPPDAVIAGVPRELRVRVQLQRRRRARLLSAVASDGGARRCLRRRCHRVDPARAARHGVVARRAARAVCRRARLSTISRRSIAADDAGRTALVDALTAASTISTRSCCVDLNWQVANGLSYFASVRRPESPTRACRRRALRAGARRRQSRHRTAGRADRARARDV
jgi:hypothetical protein